MILKIEIRIQTGHNWKKALTRFITFVLLYSIWIGGNIHGSPSVHLKFKIKNQITERFIQLFRNPTKDCTDSHLRFNFLKIKKSNDGKKHGPYIPRSMQ